MQSGKYSAAGAPGSPAFVLLPALKSLLLDRKFWTTGQNRGVVLGDILGEVFYAFIFPAKLYFTISCLILFLLFHLFRYLRMDWVIKVAAILFLLTALLIGVLLALWMWFISTHPE